MPSSPRRRVWCLLAGALLALLCAAAGAGSAAGAAAPVGAAGARTSAAVQAGPEGAAAVPAAAVVRAADRGAPQCGPGPAAPDRDPAVPARAGGHTEHGVAAGSRTAPRGGWAPCALPRALVCVRGPDRPAPRPVELSVMRV
ncbi:hypothetical protein AB0953_00220 [Streptomyces sp. NPDC046866]|uniref:hypothetical protein n=1 Tax=Streptomyces sp. NPDC046866 TaxID=3154921 RepID=UPI0034536B12